jgi:hypothetical protein
LCTWFIVQFRIAETDAEVQQRLQKWNNFLESGNVPAGHTSEENKRKIDITEHNINSADNKKQEGTVKNACTNSDLSEKTDVCG